MQERQQLVNSCWFANIAGPVPAGLWAMCSSASAVIPVQCLLPGQAAWQRFINIHVALRPRVGHTHEEGMRFSIKCRVQSLDDLSSTGSGQHVRYSTTPTIRSLGLDEFASVDP